MLALVLFTGVTGCTAPLQANEHSRLTKLKDIPLVPGVNRVDLFVPDGRSGMIVQGWRDTGNGHGYHLYVVMLPDMDARLGWDVVPLDNAQTIDDSMGSVRFVRGWMDGAPTTLLFRATRQMPLGQSLAQAAPVVFDVYRLATSRQGEQSVSGFEPVSETRAAKLYCSTDLALEREYGLKMPYALANTSDGCPSLRAFSDEVEHRKML